MSKFFKISFALAFAIFCASPTFALDEIFDPLADLYSELEKKADPDTTTESEPVTEEAIGDYLTELEKMAAEMEAAASGESSTPAADATETKTVEPASENNSVEPPTGAKISQSGGAIEDAVTPPIDNLKKTAAEDENTTPLVAGANVGSEVFVFAYDGSVATHSASNELTAAGPAAIALFALAGGLAGAYFWRRKFLNV